MWLGTSWYYIYFEIVPSELRDNKFYKPSDMTYFDTKPLSLQSSLISHFIPQVLGGFAVVSNVEGKIKPTKGFVYTLQERHGAPTAVSGWALLTGWVTSYRTNCCWSGASCTLLCKGNVLVSLTIPAFVRGFQRHKQLYNLFKPYSFKGQT